MPPILVRDEAHWRELRRTRIGGSEIGVLCGEGSFMTKYALWQQKAGNLDEPDFEDNERIFWGQVLEPAIAEGIERKRSDWLLLRPVLAEAPKSSDAFGVYYVHDRIEGMGATPDYIIIEEPDRGRGPGVLQLKNIDASEFRKNWVVEGDPGEPREERPPLMYVLQVQHELACTGFTWGYLGVLVGGNRVKLFPVDRHAGAIARIEAEVVAFWDSIARKQAPAPDWERDAKTVLELYRSATDDQYTPATYDEADALSALCVELDASRAAAREASKRAEAAKAKILVALGDAGAALSPEWAIDAGMTKDSFVAAHTRRGYRKCNVKRINVLPPKKEGT